MLAIYKYPIPRQSVPTIDMHGESPRVVMVGIDPNGIPCIWAEVDPDAAIVAHDIRTFGTGDSIGETPRNHLGSWVSGPFVWHAYSMTLRRAAP